MKNTITFAIVTVAIAAVVVGFSSLLLDNGIQPVFAQGPPNGFPENANPQGPPNGFPENANPQGPPYLVPPDSVPPGPPDNVPPGPPENYPPRPRG
jgi:hypothetical protein